MPQDQYRQVNGPEGPINFPSQMSDQDVEGAMRKLYPPKAVGAPSTPESLKNPAYSDPTKSTWTNRIGNLANTADQYLGGALRTGVPGIVNGINTQSPLETANQTYVQPHERLVGKIGDFSAPYGEYAAKAGVPGIVQGFGENDIAAGIGSAVGRTVGETAGDPVNWPLLGEGAARPMLAKLMKVGFSGLMAKGAYDAAADLHDNWSKYTVKERTERAAQGAISAVLATMSAFSKHGPEDIDKGGVIREEFGKDAQPQQPIEKPAMSMDELKARIATLEQSLKPPPKVEIKPEVKQPPVVSGPTPETRAASDAAFQKKYPVEAMKEPSPVEKELWQQSAFGQKPQEDIGAKVRNQNPEPTRAEVAKAAAPSESRPGEILGLDIPTIEARLAEIKRASSGGETIDLKAAQTRLDEYNRSLGGVRETPARLGVPQLITDYIKVPESMKPAEPVPPSSAPLDIKQEAMRKRQERTNAIAAETQRTEVGREAAPPEASKPAPASIQTPPAAQGSGEPVRSTSGSEITMGDVRKSLVKALVDEKKADKKTAGTLADHIMGNAQVAADLLKNPNASERIKTVIQLGQKLAERLNPLTGEPKDEPRSLRGDLGERPSGTPQFSGKMDFAKRLELQKNIVEQLQADPKFKGVAKTRLQEIAAEKIKSQFGGLGGYGPEDIRARREKRIAPWLKTLANPSATPEQLDFAYKMLNAFGIDHNEIIRRLSGAEGFAEVPRTERGQTPEERDQQLADAERKQDSNDTMRQMRELYEAGKLSPEDRKYYEDTLAKERELSSLEERIGHDPEADAKADRILGPDRTQDKIEEMRRADVQRFYKDFADDFRRDNKRNPSASESDDMLRRAQRMAGDPEGLIGGLVDSVDKVMRTGDPLKDLQEQMLHTEAFLEGKAKGHPDIEGVKSRDVEELDRMFNLKDERGFWRMMPSKKAVKIQPTGTAIDELTRKLEASNKAVPPNDSRMKAFEKIADSATEGWDKFQKQVGRLTAQAQSFKHWYFNLPEITDYKSSVGRFSGSLNRSAWELHEFVKIVKDRLPDKDRRIAITNYIQAGGDDLVLADRANRSVGKLRAGYEAARNLTPQEKADAKMIEQFFDKGLRDAIKMGVLDSGLDNYVPQNWKPKDQQHMGNFFSQLHRSGLLKTDFNSAKKRIFESYFEGEQAGRVPIDKDIAFNIVSWSKGLNQAVASRSLVMDQTNGLAKDGRPIVAPSGVGRPILNGGVDPEARIIYPKTGPDETGDYKILNHPALTKHVWVGTGEDGEPIFLKGDLRVHPDHAQQLDNIINRGKWAQAHPIQTTILKGQGFFKATLLSMSPFHQIQEGTHAIFHKVNPFNPGQIDLTNPSLGKLLDHGLVLGDVDPIASFEEGLTSGSGGAVGKIPGVGRQMQKYSDYLFKDYIPRLKAKMGIEAYERNLIRYDNQLKAGTITTDHIAELTANQANAAFGELNYITMGRAPQTQAILRMMFLAPDFLEARMKFAGQALHPYGREQYAALFRGALGMYGVARVLNQVLDGDPHWDKPFSLVVHGNEYQMRSLPGDIWHLLEDPNSFVMHRLNPIIIKQGWEFASGKDDYGRKRTLGEQMMDAVRSVTPIPGQSFFRGGESQSFTDKVEHGIESGAGITASKYRSKAAALAHQYALGSNPNDVTSHHITEMVQDISNGNLDSKRISQLLVDGKMNPRDLQTAMKLASMPELYRDFYRLPVELKAKVLEKATPMEAAILLSYSKREIDTTRLLPEQREEFIKNFASQ